MPAVARYFTIASIIAGRTVSAKVTTSPIALYNATMAADARRPMSSGTTVAVCG